METIELSIIVPVFNGKKYIKKTIDKLLEINKINFEILIINDGSNDETQKILEEQYSKNEKIVLIQLEENRGVSFCRNLGIQKSRGQYISFMDVDDEVNPIMYTKLIDNAKKNNLDICGCNYYEKNGNLLLKSKYNLTNEIIENKECVSIFLTDKISPAVWDKIFNRKILDNVRFDEKLRIGEDILFCLDAFLKIEKAQFINEYYYYYIQQTESAIHKVSSKLLQFKEIEYRIDKKDFNYLLENYESEFEYFRGAMILRSIHSISTLKNKDNKKEITDYIKKVYDKDKLKKLIKNRYSNKSVKIESFILTFFGVKAHLMLIPVYKFMRNIIRK